MKIVITDSDTLTNGDMSFSAFTKFGNVIRYEYTEPSRTAERIRDADVVLCNKTPMTEEVLRTAENLKYIGLFATGYNNVDIEYAKARGITVCNVPNYSTNGVVQLTFSFIFSLFSNLEKYRASVNNGDWKKSKVFSYFPYPIFELAGKTIGIVGYGSIGKAVAKVALALGMRVIVYTRTVRPEYMNDGVEFTDFDRLLSESDIVTLHCPLNKDSEKLMNKAAFEKMKKGAVLINTSRGPVVDEYALKDALLSGKLMGAGLDVLETEPMREDCPLFGIENCIITPHIAWAGAETRQRLMQIAADNLKAFIEGNPINKVF